MWLTRRQARLHTLSLVLLWSAWLASSALLLGQLDAWENDAEPLRQQRTMTSAWTILLTLVAWAAIHAVIPSLAARARLGPYRLTAAFSISGLVGGLFGFLISRTSVGPFPRVDEQMLDGLLRLRLAIGLLGLTLLMFVRLPTSALGPIFLFSRHSSDRAARLAWIVLFGQAGLMLFAWSHVRQRGEEIELGMAVSLGVLLSSCQRFSQRAIGLIPLAWLGSAFGWLLGWFRPDLGGPSILIGVCLGLAQVAPRTEIMIRIHPSRHRLGAVLIATAFALGATGAWWGQRLLTPWVPLPILSSLLAASFALFAFRGLFRELLELLVEPILGVMYRIRAFGPGVHSVPTRGPVIIIANHAAWFDPLWVAKVLPLRVRPMMTARFYDLPCISWLMRRIFFTIRVPEARFRREAPEIETAVQAIDQGDNLLIFPEGWLKRREEQSLRRFGHGIHQILDRRPQTPVIACWIEGGWGSYVSYKNGPPTVNKKPDLLRSIRIGISKPEQLTPDILVDHWRTRRYLMSAVLRARTHLGLPELPLPFPELDREDDPALSPEVSTTPGSVQGTE